MTGQLPERVKNGSLSSFLDWCTVEKEDSGGVSTKVSWLPGHWERRRLSAALKVVLCCASSSHFIMLHVHLYFTHFQISLYAGYKLNWMEDKLQKIKLEYNQKPWISLQTKSGNLYSALLLTHFTVLWTLQPYTSFMSLLQLLKAEQPCYCSIKNTVEVLHLVGSIDSSPPLP